MRILALHNQYMQHGGEDAAFEAEVALLRTHGHVVREYVDDNRRITRSNRLSVGVQSVWSWRSYAAVVAEIERSRPDVAHVHNFFPLISPAAFYACRAAGVPVVQSLDNPRLVCPAATLYRNGGLCMDCLGRVPWPGVLHACYRRIARADSGGGCHANAASWGGHLESIGFKVSGCDQVLPGPDDQGWSASSQDRR